MSDSAAPSLSIIIVASHQSRGILRACLQSIQRETPHASYEVIVSDNATTDDCPAMLREEFPSVRVLANGSNLGFARGNNRALAIATGHWVCLLNSDTIVHEQALERMAAYLKTHPEIGVLGCRLLNPDGSLQLSCYDFPSLREVWMGLTGLHRLASRPCLDPTATHRVDWVMGACLMLERAWATTLQGFDETYAIYGEDLDLCYRSTKEGRPAAYLGDARITHLGNQTAGQRWNDMQRNLRKYEAQCLFWRTHYPRWQSVLYRLLMGFGAAVR